MANTSKFKKSRKSKSNKTKTDRQASLPRRSPPLASIDSAAKAQLKSAGLQATDTAKSTGSHSESEPAVTVSQKTKAKDTLTSALVNFQRAWRQPDIRRKFSAVFWSLIGIAVTVGIMLVGFPYLFAQTEAAKNYQAKKLEAEQLAREAAELQAKLAAEEPYIQGENRQVAIITNFGEIIIETQTAAAPKTVENFLRLTHRGYFDGTIFHRMVKQPNFAIIQGGDPTGTGAGGESAFGRNQTIPDELWLVEPELAADDNGEVVLRNQPKFRGEHLYQNLDTTMGTVTYPKGVIVMAKTSAPNSAASQFFITLADTVLPAQYTIFGVVLPSSWPVLDKIMAEVNVKPQANMDGTWTELTDGIPDREIRIERARILPSNT